MDDLHDIRNRFPGINDQWARFDGPAGTQVVDAAIEAAADWQRSGSNANSHGAFAAAGACDALVEETSTVMGRLLGADPAGMVFGPSTTANMMALTRAIGRGLEPGDEIICTTLDHDSNVWPWMLMAADAGAIVRMASFDSGNARLEVSAVTSLIGPATRWVAVTGASNAVGTIPDVTAITSAAHAADARVVVDGVHLTPHHAVDVTAMGCDVYTTSSYKWYGPHAGIMWVEPGLLDALEPYNVRPAPNHGPGRFQYGTPSWEALVGIRAAADFLLDVGLDAITAFEADRFARLLNGLHAIKGVRVVGPQDHANRAPTLMFEVAGCSPALVAQQLAESHIAVWNGHNYAVEAMAPLGLDIEAGAVRAGISMYTSDADVDRLLEAVADLVDSASAS
ncbi:MAG: cysteine desulfurase-like protein [Acidimicrobiales bacterium]|nr:cysteine desulfurase-like protein [Acidimicrobiales bacterium]